MINIYKFGNGLIKCLQCNGTYRGKTVRSHKSYFCTKYQKEGSAACTNFMIRESDIEHIVKSHIQLQGKSIDRELGEYVLKIEVLNRGFKIYYKDKSEPSVVNDNSNPYGTKFKY